MVLLTCITPINSIKSKKQKFKEEMNEGEKHVDFLLAYDCP